MTKKHKLTLGFPSRALRNQTCKLFELAGYHVSIDIHSYQIEIDDPALECVLATDEEIVDYVDRGLIDAGIAQKAWLLDQKAKVVEVAELNYGNNIWDNARVILAVPEHSRVKSVKGLAGKKILSRSPNLTREYFRKHKVKAKIEPVSFPGEPKLALFGDALVDFTNTGNALATHHLRILDVLMTTKPNIIASKEAWQNRWKRRKIEDLAMLLKGARLARDMAGLTLHASGEMLKDVFKVLPALKKPTVTQLRGEHWFDVFTVAKKTEIREVMPKLKKIGCTDIVEFSLDKVVL